MFNRKSNAIRDEIKKMHDRIVELETAAEDRDFTESERREIDNLFERRDILNQDLDRAIALEASTETIMSQKLEELAASHNQRRPVSGKKFAVLNKGESARSKLGHAVDNGVGHWIRALVLGPDARDIPTGIRNTMSGNNNPAGGFVVPSVLWPEVIDLFRARSVLAEAGMQTVVSGGGDLSVAILAQDATFGIFGESQTISESDMQFNLARMDFVKVAALVRASRELVEDAVNFAEMASSALQASLAAAVDRYGIRGGGGITGLEQHPNISETGSIGAVEWADLCLAATECRKQNAEPQAAVMAPEIRDALAQKTASGLWIGSPPNNAGINLLHTTNSTSTKVVVGDFSSLMLGLRQRPLVEVSSQAGTAFANHEVLIKITTRLDFAVLRPKAFYRLADVTV